MIKVGKILYIHYSTVLFFIICCFTKRLEILVLSYFTVFLHELTHMLTAFLIGAEPSYIAFFPFGVNLRIKNNILYSISDEILLYLSGPLLNAVIALFLQFFEKKDAYLQYFYLNNIMLFLFNLLPILPMDGGMVLKRILSDIAGSRRAEKILKIISIILIFLLFAIETLLIIIKKPNFSIIFIIVFLTANIFTNKEKYNIGFIKELLYIKNKRKRSCVKAEVYLSDENYPERKIAENFNAAKSYIVIKKNKKGEIIEILTEEEVIDRVLSRKKLTFND